MDGLASSKLDILWTIASEEYVQDLIQQSRVPQDGAKIDEITQAKILRMIRKEQGRAKHRKWLKVLRIALVACLAVSTLMLAACMALPTVREAIWSVVLDWRETSVEIDFVPEESSVNGAAATGESIYMPGDSPTEAPYYLKEVNMPSYVPEGYSVQASGTTPKSYSIGYYNAEGKYKGDFTQLTLSFHTEVDCEEATVTETTVHGLNAILVTYTNEPNAFALCWQDRQYRYLITGHFASLEEVLAIADSVAVK